MLDHSLDFVKVGIRSRVDDIGVEEAEISCKSEADGLRVGTEVVGGDQATETVYHVNTFRGQS